MAEEAKQGGTVKLTEHAKKYDRQMRLWGAHGQKLLEEGKICMLGSNVAASETLKNCVLPAVGIFTIIDDVDVTISDLGNNFFVTQDDVGKKRAQVVSEWLLEMNPDVSGSAVIKNPRDIINNEIDYFKQFNIVLSTQLYGEANRKLAKFCWDNNIPYMSIKINGFLACLRVQFQELCIMESHPTNDRTDLFIYPEQLKTFPELEEFANSFDIDTKDVTEHAHLPCIAILAQFTKRYLEKNDNKLPDSWKAREEFKDEISSMGNGENYDDARHWASQCYFPPRIDRDVQQVLDDPKAKKLDENSSNFWVLVRGLKDYMENEGAGFLPCSTNIPDLTMDSKSYVKLKSIYKDRAKRDLDLITGYVCKRLEELKRDKASIADELIDRFVKNVRSLKVVRTKSMEDEYKPITDKDTDRTEEFDELYMDMSAFEEEKDEPKAYQPLMIHWYWAFRALDDYYDKNKRVPGLKSTMETKYEERLKVLNDQIPAAQEDEAKMEELIKASNELLKEFLAAETSELEELQAKLTTFQQHTPLVEHYEKLDKDGNPEEGDPFNPCLAELVRYAGAEMHNIGAFVGGVAAQGIMKILLRQFFPYNNTYVFNGINCEGAVFKI